MRSALALASFLLAGTLLSCGRRPAPPLDSPPEAPAAQAPPAAPDPPRVPLTSVASDPSIGGRVVVAELRARRLAIVASDEDRAVLVVDPAQRRLVQRVDLDSRPGQLIVSEAGDVIVARRDRADVLLLHGTDDLERPLRRGGSIATADEPIALAVANEQLFVAAGVSSRLEAFDLDTGERAWAVDTAREPRAVAVSSDKVFVTHAAASTIVVVRRDGAELASMPIRDSRSIGGCIATKTPPAPLPFEDRTSCMPTKVALHARHGSSLVRFAGKRERLLVTDVLVDPGASAHHALSSGYGGTRSAPVEFDVRAIGGSVLLQHGRDDVAIGACPLPSAATSDPASGRMFVACLGTNKVAEATLRPSGDDVVFATESLHSTGAGATGLAFVADRDELYVHAEFDRTLSIYTPDPEWKKARFRLHSSRARVDINVGPSPTPLGDAAALGRRLFHDAGNTRISGDGRACVSCHPDGRDDGLVWSSPEGPRQTPTLAGRIDGGPFSWSGAHATVADHLRETVKRLHGSGLRADELAALEAYLRWLPPAPRSAARSSEAALRGERIFRSSKTQCASCHPADDGFADRDRHDVGSKTAGDRAGAFRTPSLRFVGRTGPYFHDGRYATLRELLRKCDGTMGTTAHLSDENIAELEAYLETL